MTAVLMTLSLFVAFSASVVGAIALENVSTVGARRPNLRVRGSSPAQSSSSSRSNSSNKSGSLVRHPSQSLTQPKQMPVKAEGSALIVATPPIFTAGAPDLQDTDVPDAGRVVAQLRQEAQEVRQHRANIVQMKQALTADVALLRESSALQRVSASRRSKAAAQTQLRKTEQLVKDLGAMLRESRSSALEDAKYLLSDATEIRAAADALASEASAQLRALAPRSNHPGHHSQPAATEPVQQTQPLALPVASAPKAQAVPLANATEPDALIQDTDDSDIDDDA